MTSTSICRPAGTWPSWARPGRARPPSPNCCAAWPTRPRAGSGLLILDEATSAVDPETERALSHALDLLSEGRTTVMIAHRLSTAEKADMVLVFDRGRIVERGTHTDLVAAGGVYASLYESW